MTGKSKKNDSQKQTGSVEHLIPIHPVIWEKLEHERLATGISKRKQVQHLLCERFGLEPAEYVIDGDADARLIEWREQNGDQKRA